MPPKLSEDAPQVEFAKSHPELHHYTTLEGLKGIWSSRTLWATHYSKLNDAAELVLLKEPLIKAAAERFVPIAKSLAKQSLRARRTIERLGGLEEVCAREARGFVEVLYKVTFHETETAPFADPFITSFCSHAGDRNYERENGLLSQWRGYGSGGGYCIVFDTRELQRLLDRELESFYWSHINFGSVMYADESFSVSSHFADLIDLCEDFIKALMNGGEPDFSRGFGPFVANATSLKHQGFKEEREVRIVAAPSTQKLVEYIRSQDTRFKPEHPIKTVHRRMAGFTAVPFIKLFETIDAALSIKRVIVGPSRHQDANFACAGAVLRGAVELRRSETPFIG
jgi:hypothetical protein